ncbi:hypothetical protein BpHYR1_040202 [Brachionus plicatilis]|uniref:Uncharacterized protein n=1 Tax=Brachionus plicatilis TaxID=10195 RepID=A0A3M7QUQ1_BRAPC|nr:hypothetical protein BpHYR1_040202 [Brachionus plicatilis]
MTLEVEKEIGNVTEKQLSIEIAHLRLYKGGRILSLDSILSTFWSLRRPESWIEVKFFLKNDLLYELKTIG